LPQSDHRQPGLEGIGTDLRPGDGQRRLQRGVGKVRELVGDGIHRLDRLRRTQVTGGDPQQGAPVGDPQRVSGELSADRYGSIGVGPDRGEQRAA
jgi:hypothetical protein